MRPAALTLAAVALAASLSACGTDIDETVSARVLQGVAQTALQRRGKAPDTGTTPAGLTRAFLATLGGPVDLITVEGTGASGLVEQIGSNGGVETWVSADDKTVSWRDGMVVATRGFGPDLIAASVPGAATVAAGGSWQRVHVVLDGLDQLRHNRFSCVATPVGAVRIVIVERSYDTRLVRETCTGSGQEFVNEYWFDQGTRPRQSRQWINEGFGHLTIRHLSN